MNQLTFKKCIKELTNLSIPMIMGNLGLMLIGITDILVASKHSINTLSAISIANAIVFCIYIIGIGLMSSISIVLSNYRGDKKPTKLFLTKLLIDRKSTRLNSSHPVSSRMPSSA